MRCGIPASKTGISLKLWSRIKSCLSLLHWEKKIQCMKNYKIRNYKIRFLIPPSLLPRWTIWSDWLFITEPQFSHTKWRWQGCCEQYMQTVVFLYENAVSHRHFLRASSPNHGKTQVPYSSQVGRPLRRQFLQTLSGGTGRMCQAMGATSNRLDHAWNIQGLFWATAKGGHTDSRARLQVPATPGGFITLWFASDSGRREKSQHPNWSLPQK